MKLAQRVISFVTLIVGSCILIFFSTRHKPPEPTVIPKPAVPRGFLMDTPGCSLPDFDPLSSEILHLYKDIQAPYECPGKPAFVIAEASKLRIDYSLLLRHYQLSVASCRYWIVERNVNSEYPDDTFYLRSPVGPSTFVDSIEVESDVVFVRCYDKYKDLFYKNYHAVIARNQTVDTKLSGLASSRLTPNHLNIVVLGIDSVSKLNFLRHFNKTYELLTRLDAVELHGYNKVEDSTLVNMIPFLTGKYVEHYWNGSEPSFYDHVDEIWKYYAKIGYRTLFAEDFPEIGMFNYQKKGLRHPPTDHYYRPYAQSIEQSFIRGRSRYKCIDSKLEPVYLLNWLDAFTDIYKNDPFYAFTWTSKVSHDDINEVRNLDQLYYEFVRKLNSRGTLNNTVVIFLSDHGLRFGGILETYIGRYEQRLPFMFLLFPKHFLENHPDIAENVKTNKRRLTTPFDMYETQKDLLRMAGGEKAVAGMNDSPGISLFREIPKSRTCDDATIIPHFCACDRYESVDVKKEEVTYIANYVVDSINSLTEVKHDVCAKSILKSVVESGTMVLSSEKSAYRLVIIVGPSLGMFEATVSYYPQSRSVYLEGRITRINKYGSQSHCVKDSSLKPYCFCIQ